MGTGFSMPHLGSFRARARLAILICAMFVPSLRHRAATQPCGAWPWSGDPAKEAVGSAQWWKKHKKNAVFEPGKGYKVEGVDGYFDGDGRPIAGPGRAGERSSRPARTTEEVGLIPGPRSARAIRQDEGRRRPGAERAVRAAGYAEGDRLFREKEYKAAAEKFEAAIERGPHSPIEQDAMFMLAESYFFDDRYIKARDAYDALVKEHPNTRYLDTVIDREWKIARYWEEYERKQSAIGR